MSACQSSQTTFFALWQNRLDFFWMGKRDISQETEPIMVRNWSVSRKAVETFLFLSFVVIHLPSYSWKTNRHLPLDRYSTCSDALQCWYFPKAYWKLRSLDGGWGGKAEGCSDVSPVWFSPCKEDFISQQLLFVLKIHLKMKNPVYEYLQAEKNVKQGNGFGPKNFQLIPTPYSLFKTKNICLSAYRLY